ncbi:hypothetical protein FRB93_013553 [Tulasnella sp. JGI-2019a]|nr:hypothetical protein FRB93_013553 [Tulasnella sp. JGI-2019a]
MGWSRFVMVRMAVFALAALGAAAVLGMAIHQSTLFLHNHYDKPYLIFALVVSVLTLVVCLVLSMRYSFYTHIGLIALMAILWLALASYTTDRIGYVQCEALDGQTRPAKNSRGQYNSVSWCRELKAMMAFSWFVWGLFMIAIVSWIRLSEHEENTYGEGSEHERHEERAMEEEEREEDRYVRRGHLESGIPGGGLGPRYVSTAVPQFQYQNTGMPMQQATGMPMQQGNVVYQQPGHDVVIQNGQVTQVPRGTYVQQGVPVQQAVPVQGVPVQQLQTGQRIY